MIVIKKLNKLSNYGFGIQEAQEVEDSSVDDKMTRLTEEFKKSGTRKSVEAVLLVYSKNHPHVLLLQNSNSTFRLPGDQLAESEDFKSGLMRILQKTFGIPGVDETETWQIGDFLSCWNRPNFEPYLFPYLPPHIKIPKETISIYLVELPATKVFAVPKNYKLVAVPLYELYDNQQRYGPIISSLPFLLSKYNFISE